MPNIGLKIWFIIFWKWEQNWAVWKTTAVAYMKRLNFMTVPNAPDLVAFPDEDGALLTMIMNCTD
jgi:hypothetical protein